MSKTWSKCSNFWKFRLFDIFRKPDRKINIIFVFPDPDYPLYHVFRPCFRWKKFGIETLDHVFWHFFRTGPQNKLHIRVPRPRLPIPTNFQTVSTKFEKIRTFRISTQLRYFLVSWYKMSMIFLIPDLDYLFLPNFRPFRPSLKKVRTFRPDYGIFLASGNKTDTKFVIPNPENLLFSFFC